MKAADNDQKQRIADIFRGAVRDEELAERLTAAFNKRYNQASVEKALELRNRQKGRTTREGQLSSAADIAAASMISDNGKTGMQEELYKEIDELSQAAGMSITEATELVIRAHGGDPGRVLSKGNVRTLGIMDADWRRSNAGSGESNSSEVGPFWSAWDIITEIQTQAARGGGGIDQSHPVARFQRSRAIDEYYTESLPALISGESLDNVTAHYRAFRSGLNREEGEKTAETRQAVNRVMVGEDLEVQALMGQEIETRYSLGRLSYELGESVVTEVATLGAMKAFTAARMSLKSMRAARASRAFSVLNSGKRLLTGLRYGRISRTAASVAQKMPTAIGTGIRKLGTSIAGNYRRLKASQMLVNGLIDGTKSVAIEQTVRTDLPLWSKQSAVTFGFAFATGGFGTHLNNPFKNGLMSMTTNYFGQKSVQAFVDPGYEVSYGQMLLTGALSTGSAWTERYLHEEFSGGAGLSKGGRLWGAKWSNGVPWLGIEVGVAGITEYLNES